MDLSRAFHYSGAANKMGLFLAVIGIGLAVAAVVKLRRGGTGRGLGAAAVGVGVLVLAAGAGGTWHSRQRTDEAVSLGGLGQSQKETLRRAGYADSRYALDFGLGFAAVPVLLGGVALVAATRKQRRGVGLPVALLGLAGLAAAGDIAMLGQPLPGSDSPPAAATPPGP